MADLVEARLNIRYMLGKEVTRDILDNKILSAQQFDNLDSTVAVVPLLYLFLMWLPILWSLSRCWHS